MKKNDLKRAKNEWIGEQVVRFCNFIGFAFTKTKWTDEVFEESEAYSFAQFLYNIFLYFYSFSPIGLFMLFLYFMFENPEAFGALVIPLIGLVFMSWIWGEDYANITKIYKRTAYVIFYVPIVIPYLIFSSFGFYSKELHEERLKEEKKRSKKK